MAVTPSTQLALGSPLPGFSLPEPATGGMVSSDDLGDASAVLVMFICNHCPVRGARAGRVRADSRRLRRCRPGDDRDQLEQRELPPPGRPREHEAASSRRWAGSSRFCSTSPRRWPGPFKPPAPRSSSCSTVLVGWHTTASWMGPVPAPPTPLPGETYETRSIAVLDGRAPSSEQKPCIGCSIKWE